MRSKIKYYRRRQWLTQAKLARKAGLSQSSISNYESGDSAPPEEAKRRIAAALGKKKVETVFPRRKKRRKLAGA